MEIEKDSYFLNGGSLVVSYTIFDHSLTNNNSFTNRISYQLQFSSLQCWYGSHRYNISNNIREISNKDHMKKHWEWHMGGQSIKQWKRLQKRLSQY